MLAQQSDFVGIDLAQRADLDAGAVVFRGFAWRREVLDIEEKRRVIVGQNEFVGDAPPIPVMTIDPALEQAQRQRLAAWRSEREAGSCQAALQAIKAAAGGDDNLVPLFIVAVKAGGTVGEISDTLREAWGEHEETVTI